MAHQSEPPATHIPPFAKPLAPYIKSRQEALRIRQVLTSYLRPQIIFADDDSDYPDCHAHSHLSLCVPQDALVDVKRPPPDVTGLRKEYLKALQANVAARKDYNSVSEKAIARKSQGPSSAAVEIQTQDSSFELQKYLSLLKDRRRYAKLQTFQHYLQELRARGPAGSDDFDSKEGRNQQLPLAEEFEDGAQGASTVEGGIEGLVHKLERAVIRAKSQLDREKRLFDELKAQHDSDKQSHGEIDSSSNKVVALKRMRDELVQWVEEKLVSGGGNDDGPIQELPADELEESTQLLEERKAEIAKQYVAYIKARKRLLDAASKACQPVTIAPAKSPPRPAESQGAAEEAASSLEPLDVLQFATHFLLPLSKSQRALAVQKSYMAGLLAKEKATTRRTLNRLSDESHLLPEYPILAREPRFKHAAAAMHSRHSSTATEPMKPDEVVSLAEAWAFASTAAGSGEREYTEQKVTTSDEIAQDAQQALQDVYGMLNQDLDEVLAEDPGREEDKVDIWTQEVRSSRSQMRPSRTDRRTKGPWSGLNGKVDIAN